MTSEPQFLVVKNHEDQYSIWPEGKDLPAGWVADGMRGDKATCLEHINTVWTDMRPRSLREAMERDGLPRGI